jgi:flavodoxin I
MTSIGLYYGSSKGNTEGAAERIKKEFDKTVKNGSVTLVDVKTGDITGMSEYDKLILGTSTWENGQLQEYWQNVISQIDKVDLNGKQVALFGFGDQYEFADTFLDALGTLAARVRERGGELVGYWPTDGYNFDQSEAVEDGHFVGLALDSANQYEMTRKRIKAWVQQISGEFGLG